ncbi:MAG: aminotransferase class III [Candidatus Pelagibacter sp.]|nr:aminotransferase class III [Candidatus Pelagibacter sp.]|tara:strand:- start:1502 stop:2800 length:1299 start_codon:yes stop_codon:yes gene_type:complete
MKLKKNRDWNKAKKIILGGNSLLSKRPEMFLPDYWPTYFSKASGIYVWDTNGKKYIDMIFAVGQNTLGYSNKKIDNKVKSYISKGTMSTLNCIEELELAKKLIKIHPWAGMVKFARSGGEANSIAIRIARAASGKDNVAICGYHGWHDWYLSVNLKSKNNLSQHLLPGLIPKGVPKSLKNNVHAFENNNFDKLKQIYSRYKIGTLIIEIARSNLPNIKFLKKVKKFCNEKKIILIFDECTSGFRRNLGGVHLLTKIYPDIAMFGKAIGNGYAITCVVGKKNIMKKAGNTFISSTMWSERVGFVAALATINEIEKTKSYKKLIRYGKYINKGWKNLSNKHDLDLKISGIESITSFTFPKNNQIYKTFISQEMLKKGYLASNLIYFCSKHSYKVIDEYLVNLDKIFMQIKNYSLAKIKKKIKGKISHNTFKRLN